MAHLREMSSVRGNHKLHPTTYYFMKGQGSLEFIALVTVCPDCTMKIKDLLGIELGSLNPPPEAQHYGEYFPN